jgi:hypothetical protein
MNRWLLCLLLCPKIVLSGAAQENGGKVQVLVANGWKSSGGSALKVGDWVSKDSDISAGDNAGVLVLDCGSEGWLSYECHEACRIAPCSAPKDHLPRRIDLASQTVAAEGRSRSLFRYQPKEAAIAGVRAPGNPNDAVLLRDSAGVHFGPALKRVLEGEYCLRLTRLGPTSQTQPQAVKINWDRSVDPDGLVSGGDIGPGLYSLAKGTRNGSGGCDVPADAIAAWVLIVPERKYATFAADWKNVDAQSRDLASSGTSREAIVTAEHAVLASMADALRGQ